MMLSACSTLKQAGLPAPLAVSLAQSGIPDSAAALEIRAADGGVLAAHNQHHPFKPASIMKLVTTAAALELLGPNYRWMTRVYARGKLSDEVLHGDLIIEGGGDPRFAHEDLSRMLRRLRQLGVREINGDLVLDRRLFQKSSEDSAAFDALPLRAYNALPDALLLDAKALSVRFKPDLQTQRVQITAEPALNEFSIESPDLGTQPCSNWREQLKPELTRNALKFAGTYSVDCGERVMAMHLYTLNHLEYFDAVFRRLWAELGGTLTGSTRDMGEIGNIDEASLAATATELPTELLRWESLTLAEIIRDINKHSNNVMARELLLGLSAQRGGLPATTVASSERVLGWLATTGIATASIVIENGSGLSRNERLSADALAALLQHSWHSPLMPEFIASLPLAGIDGTMSRRLPDSLVRARAHIKTGSLADVASMAGYVTAKSGRRIIVVCMVNHPNAGAARAGFDQLLEWIYERY